MLEERNRAPTEHWSVINAYVVGILRNRIFTRVYAIYLLSIFVIS